MPLEGGTDLATQVAWACRILAMEGQHDFTLGHVSARAAGSDLVYMKRKGVGLDEVTVQDILTIDLTGKKRSGQGEVHREYPLHTEVYKARDDVGAVVHVHPRFGTALGGSSGQLELVSHYAVLFADGLARFEATPDLITTESAGRQVVEALGSSRAVLLRNHGVLVVGKNVPWAVVTAVCLERAIELQYLARGLGQVRPMTLEEARELLPRTYSDSHVMEFWEYLVRQAQRMGARVA